jgi:hypothetical protein
MGRQIVEMCITRRIGIILSIFLVISLSVVALYPVSPASAIPWSISTVATTLHNINADEGWNSSIAVDSSGNIHVSYYYPFLVNGTSGELRYAKWSSPSGPWTITTVDSTSANVGKYCSIALDSSGNPHISYRDATFNKIKYARWTGSDWSTGDVDGPPNTGFLGNYGTSIAVDSSGNAHISYNWDRGSHGDLKYAKWTGSSWYITLAEQGATGTIGRYSAIALDSSGNPHISYYNSTSGYLRLKYASWNPLHTPYPFDTTPLELGSGPYSSIAVDSSDNIHVSYYYRISSSSGYLKYAKWSSPSGPWTYTPVDQTSGNLGKYCSIALDSNGNPHISYRDVTYIKLKYAMWTGSAWSIEDVDPTADVGTLGAIALDSCNNPYISYYDYTNNLIKCAIGTFHSKPTATASSNSPVFEGATIQLNGGPDSMIYYNWYGPDGWTSTYKNPSRPNATTGMSGPYYLSVFDGTCTSDNATTNVIVNTEQTQCVNTATGTGIACFTTSNGSIIDLTAANSTPCGTLPGFIFPYGLFSFTIFNIPPGSTVTITITLPSNMPTNTQYWKCINGHWVNVTSLLGDNDGDNILTLTIKDGGLGDADGHVNGTIVDPGGPAILPPTVTRVSPNSGVQGQTLGTIVTGTNFTGPTAVSFGAGITVNSLAIDSATQIMASITIASNASIGARDVSVTTPFVTGTLTGGFTVNPAPPAKPRVSPRSPASMSVQYMSINPQQVYGNQPVTISTNVANTGGEAGSLNVALNINGQVEQTKMVSVGPQGTQQVKFTVTKAQPGIYTVDIGGQHGNFTILGVDSTTTSKGANVGLIAILAVLILVTVVILMLTSRRPA